MSSFSAMPNFRRSSEKRNKFSLFKGKIGKCRIFYSKDRRIGLRATALDKARMTTPCNGQRETFKIARCRVMVFTEQTKEGLQISRGRNRLYAIVVAEFDDIGAAECRLILNKVTKETEPVNCKANFKASSTCHQKSE